MDEKTNGAWSRLTSIAGRLQPEFGSGALAEACREFPAVAAVARGPNGECITALVLDEPAKPAALAVPEVVTRAAEAARAEALEIAKLCAESGDPARAVEFLGTRATVADVRQALIRSVWKRVLSRM